MRHWSRQRYFIHSAPSHAALSILGLSAPLFNSVWRLSTISNPKGFQLCCKAHILGKSECELHAGKTEISQRLHARPRGGGLPMHFSILRHGTSSTTGCVCKNCLLPISCRERGLCMHFSAAKITTLITRSDAWSTVGSISWFQQ